MRTHSILNLRTAVIAFALAVALVSPALHAQRRPILSQVDIPFAFEVGSTHFAAGKYTLSNSTEHALDVQGAKRSAITMSWHEIGLRPSPTSKVVFYRYGNQYFLREVWTQGNADHLYCPESKAEREAGSSPKPYDRASLAARTHVEIAEIALPERPR
jgi:hypothetical protein